MKYIFTLLLTAGMAATFAQDEITLKTDEQKEAYYCIPSIIDSLRYNEQPIQEDVMLLATEDAVNGKPSRIADVDMKVVTARLEKKWLRQRKWDLRKKAPKDPKKWTDEEIASYDAIYPILTWYSKNRKRWFDKAIVLQSAKDAFGEKKVNRLENENIILLNRRLEMKAYLAGEREMSSSGRERWEAGIAYQKANKKKEGVKVTASGLQYRVIEEGTGKRPTTKDTVSAIYKTTLIDGKLVRNQAKPMEFRLDALLLQGLVEGLQLMKAGAKYELVVPAELGFGAYSKPLGAHGIPPSFSTLIIEVELVGIVKKK